jgi:hypothetical protein
MKALILKSMAVSILLLASAAYAIDDQTTGSKQKLNFDDVTIQTLERDPVRPESIDAVGRKPSTQPLYRKKREFKKEMQRDLEQLGDVL